MPTSKNIALIYNRYVDDMYAYALHLGFNEDTVMDAIHDVFYKLHINRVSFENIYNPKFYLFRALKNRLIDICKESKEYLGLTRTPEKISESMPFRLQVTIEDEMIREEDLAEIRQKVENVLNNLTDRQREIVYLKYINEYTYEEIAELMQISVLACRNLLSKSMTKLKALSKPILQDFPFIFLFIHIC